MWKQGNINGYAYWVKCYEECSQYGISGGRISKLSIRNKGGYEIYSYDRGLDFDRLNHEGKTVYNEILEMYN